MSVVNKIFENTKINIVKEDDGIWFKAKPVAQVLGYSNLGQAIRYHIEPEDRKKIGRFKGAKNDSLKR
jgi:prophage antirepressor-like protein